MSAVERASKASRAEQANERGVRAIEHADEQMAQLSTCRFYAISTQSAVVAVAMAAVHSGMKLYEIGAFIS